MPHACPYRFGLVLFAFCTIALGAGCSSDSSPRSVVTLESINDNLTLNSDVYNNGPDGVPGTSDDYILEDHVSFAVRNRPHDPALNVRAGGPFSVVVFQRFEVRFDGPESLPDVTGPLNLRVSSGNSASGEITIVPAGYKADPTLPLISLRRGGEYRFQAHVTLIGQEEDSKDPVKVSGILPVNCANWSD